MQCSSRADADAAAGGAGASCRRTQPAFCWLGGSFFPGPLFAHRAGPLSATKHSEGEIIHSVMQQCARIAVCSQTPSAREDRACSSSSSSLSWPRRASRISATHSRSVSMEARRHVIGCVHSILDPRAHFTSSQSEAPLHCPLPSCRAVARRSKADALLPQLRHSRESRAGALPCAPACGTWTGRCWTSSQPRRSR